jgi:phosphocarrier protein
MSTSQSSGNVLLTHAVGLHARPSVKLTKLAKTFGANIDIAPGPDGPWIDAKSIVRVMGAKVPQGRTCISGAVGQTRLLPAALIGLVERDFDDTSPMPGQRVEHRGRLAAPGVAAGRSCGSTARSPAAGQQRSAKECEDLRPPSPRSPRSASLPESRRRRRRHSEFQIAMLEEDALIAPALDRFRRGSDAATAWTRRSSPRSPTTRRPDDYFAPAAPISATSATASSAICRRGEPRRRRAPCCRRGRDAEPLPVGRLAKRGGSHSAAGSPSSHAAMLRCAACRWWWAWQRSTRNGHATVIVDGDAGLGRARPARREWAAFRPPARQARRGTRGGSGR